MILWVKISSVLSDYGTMSTYQHPISLADVLYWFAEWGILTWGLCPVTKMNSVSRHSLRIPVICLLTGL